MLNISVIIPVYNAEAFLKKAVDSVLQFSEVKEVLLIEDQSTDQSLELCKKLSLKNSKINLYQHSDEGNHGAGASRNLGLEKASQDFIAFLDADDYYLPNRFEAEKKIFENPKIEGVFGAIGTKFLTENAKKEFEEKFKINNNLTTVEYAAEGKEIFRGLLGLNTKTFGSFFHLNTLTIKRASLKKNNLKFNEDLRVHQDSDFIIKLSYHCYLKSGIIDRAIAIRGVHDDNRITKIKPYSKKYYERQSLLWNSLYNWSKRNTLKKDETAKLFLTQKSYEITLQSGLKKWANLGSTVLKNPEILRTKYRYNYLKK